MVVQAALSLLMKCFMAVSIITDMYLYSILSLMYGLYMGVALPPSDTLTNQCSSSSRPYYCTEQRQPQVVILSSMASLALSLPQVNLSDTSSISPLASCGCYL